MALVTNKPRHNSDGKAYALANGFRFLPSKSEVSQLEQTLQKQTYFNREFLNSHNVINSQTKDAHKPQKARRRNRKYRARWERLEEKSRTKSRVCVLLDELKTYELADKFRACHSRFLATTCGEHITERRATFYCGHRACVFCAEIHAGRKRENYSPKLAAYAQTNERLTLCHLVLTQKHYRGELLLTSIKRLLSSFRKLIRRGVWKSHLAAGGLYAVEFTLGADGCWHAHLHILVFRNKFFDVRLFRREWKAVTGDSVNFKIDRVSDIESGLVELVKYISKPLDADKFTAAHFKQVLDLKGQRLFSSFGAFRKFAAEFEVPEAETSSEGAECDGNGICPHCSQPLFSLMLDIRGLIELERFICSQRGRPPNIVRNNSS